MGTLKRVKFEMPPDDEEPKVHMRSREGRLSPCSHRGSATLLSFLRRTDTYAPCSDRGAVARPRVPYRSNSMYIGTASISWPRDYSTIIPQRITGVFVADVGKKKKNRTLAGGSQQLDLIHSTGTTVPTRNAQFNMQLTYVTDRIIAALFPSDGTDAQYRTGLKDATVLLRRNHPERYKVFNVSKKRSDLGRLHPVVELGWPQELAPPLDRLCSICKMFENWLAANKDNVIVVHCKGGRSRAAIVVAAYMHYIMICSSCSEESVADRFAMQRFSERFLGADAQPSHKRYVNYFASLLSGRTKINPSTIYLHQIALCNFSPRNVLFKIYERMQPVHTTHLTQIRERTVFDFDDLPVRGDILVKCFQRTATSERSPFFRCQFNTCTFDLSKRDGRVFTLQFHKDELDVIFNEGSVENGAVIEFIFLIDAPYSTTTTNTRRSIGDCSRADSYENFEKEEEEDRSESFVGGGVSADHAEIHRPADSTDSGIGSDSANTAKDKGGMPPVPPPKPRLSVDAGRRDQEAEETRRNEHAAVTRSHSALPATVRPSPTPRSASPMDGRSTPCIEPDLVAKDRYDPASRCFSYVPAKALNEHFTTPRKPMQWQRADEPSALDTPPLPSEIANVPLVSTDLVRRPETPKWDDEIDKIANEYAKGGRIETVHGDVAKESALANGPLSSAVNAMSASASEFDSQIEEKPLVIDQAKRATKRRKTKCGSYRTLNDDAYSSDMDDLCDPDFYLTYGAPHSADARLYNTDAGAAHSIEVGSLRRPASAMSRPTSKSVELPRRPFREISQRGRTTIDEAMSTPKPATSLSELNRERDAFRNRNCRSATSAPIYRESRGSRFYDDRYDSLTDAENADDWLKSQLRKLKTKRENNPEMLRRKRQEKMLLEELKHANDDRQMARGRDERNYTVEGYGQRSDPLAEYRMEEERLRNTRSPYPERRDREEPFAPRRVMPPKSTDVVRHKPPTPPPRARSRSPPASPYLRRSYTRTPTHESAYQQERNNLNRSEDNELINDLDEGEFSHLRNIVQFQDRNIHTEGPSMNLGRSILKRRDVSNENSSPSLSRRGLTTPVEEWSTASINRAPTPSFPVRRETPLPYHPLLFNGACEAMPAGTTLNYRSASPRSLYYEQSRRTSMTSLEPGEIIHHHPVFVKDTSKYWYKPTISREEAINMLRDKPPGTFVVRDSNSFPGAFGLALKVATPPPGIHSGDGTELVRHFLIEPSPKGVKLKGCNNEPVFGTLSALVYQHSITPLALPTKLLLPDYDPASTPEHISAAQALLQQGAACNVTYIASLDTESLTGPEAVRRCIGDALELYTKKMVQPVSVHFKVSSQGVTVTDNTRRLFFRRHYPVQSVTFAGIDPADRRWDNSCISEGLTTYVKSARMFAFVARKIGSRTDNACHVFAELEPEQPASAVVNFITKVMMGRK